MLNCGLHRLRLVAPRDGWPNEKAVSASADADRVIETVDCFATVREAVADCSRVFATTARQRSRQIPALEVSEAVREIRGGEEQVCVLFGPEASGLDNESLSYADRLLDFPVNPEFSSLNLSQAVLLFSWEWWRGSVAVERTAEPAAKKAELGSFLDRLENELERGRFFLSEEMRPETVRNLRAFFGKAAPTERELGMLHGVITALSSDCDKDREM
jgi:tRNA/rRNA methyltransferase